MNSRVFSESFRVFSGSFQVVFPYALSGYALCTLPVLCKRSEQARHRRAPGRCRHNLRAGVLVSCGLSGSHRSTRIASGLASHTLASQARPRSNSPNRWHFASLDVKKTYDFLASQANIAGFSRKLSGTEFLLFLCNIRGLRIASENHLSHR